MAEAAPRLQPLLRELVLVAFSAQRPNDPLLTKRLTRALGERHVPAGEPLFQVGDAPDVVYFMTGGRVRFSRPRSPTFVREGRWAIGIQEAVAGVPRRRTAVAISDTSFLTVPARTWTEILEDNVELARAFVLETARGVVGLHEKLGPDGGFPDADCGCPPPGSPFNVVERLLFMRRVPFLGDAGVQALTDIARAAEEVSFEPGELVLERGAPRDRMFVVASGLVEARREDPKVVAHFGGGRVIGGAVSLGDQERAWEARALQPTRALAVPVEFWADEMDDHFDLFRAAMATLIDQRETLVDDLVLRSGDLVLR